MAAHREEYALFYIDPEKRTTTSTLLCSVCGTINIMNALPIRHIPVALLPTTDWFPADLLPAYSGPYKVKVPLLTLDSYEGEVEAWAWFCAEKKRWGKPCEDLRRAVNNRWSIACGGGQARVWKGITAPYEQLLQEMSAK